MELDAARPFTSAKDPSEWQMELSQIAVYRDSTEWIDGFSRYNIDMHEREVQARRREREAREREDAWQTENRERIRRENEIEAAALREQACTFCFCIHPGEC